MIIRDLIDRNVSFAVIKYYNWLTEGRFVQNEEWEVIVPASEVHKTKGIVMYAARDIKKGSKSRILTLEETAEFRELLPNCFDCVERNDYGAVYELKDKPNTRELLTQKHW